MDTWEFHGISDLIVWTVCKNCILMRCDVAFRSTALDFKAPEPGPQACPLRLSAFQRPILQLPRWGSCLPRPENQNVVSLNLIQAKHERILRLSHEMIWMDQRISGANIASKIVNKYPKSILFLEEKSKLQDFAQDLNLQGLYKGYRWL